MYWSPYKRELILRINNNNIKKKTQKNQTAFQNECGGKRSVCRVSGWWVGWTRFSSHGRDRLCKCVNLIFKRTALPVGPMRANRAWHLAINPARLANPRSHIGSFLGGEKGGSDGRVGKWRWLPARSRSPERWRATRQLSWHRSIWCQHRCPTRRSSTPRYRSSAPFAQHAAKLASRHQVRARGASRWWHQVPGHVLSRSPLSQTSQLVICRLFFSIGSPCVRFL